MEGMQMNDPQVWTLIGVFAAVMLGGMTLMTTMMSRVVRAEIGGLRNEMNGRFDGVAGEITGLRGEMNGRFNGVAGEITGLHGEIAGLRGEMNARFDTVDHKVATLDKEVAALATKLWGSP